MSRRCRASASLCSDRSLAVCTGTLGSASFTVSASASGSVSLPKIPGEPTLRVLVFFDPVGRIVARHRRQSVIEQHGDVGTAEASSREVGPAIPVKARAHDAVRAVSCPGIHGNIEGALAVARRQEGLAVAVAGKTYCRGVVVGILVEVRTRNVGRGVFPRHVAPWVGRLGRRGRSRRGYARISAAASVTKSVAYLRFILFSSIVETSSIAPRQVTTIAYCRIKEGASSICVIFVVTSGLPGRPGVVGFGSRLNAASDEGPFECQGVCEASQVLALGDLDCPEAGEVIVLDLAVQQREAPLLQAADEVDDAHLRGVGHAAEHRLPHERPA